MLCLEMTMKHTYKSIFKSDMVFSRRSPVRPIILPKTHVRLSLVCGVWEKRLEASVEEVGVT